MLHQKTSLLYYAMVILAFVSVLLSGCGDTEELEEQDQVIMLEYNAEADEALAKAEKAMKEAGIEADFNKVSDLESLGELRAILPDSAQIKQLEKQQKMEEAIGSLYVALDALGESFVSHAPARTSMVDPDGVLDTDLALIHLRLAYCSVFAAISRLARAGIGPDGIPDTGDDLFYISSPEELEPETPEVYKFMLTDKGQALMDSVDPDDPYGYIKVFYDEGQVEALQAIVDSVSLLLCAEVSVIENPVEGIKAHRMQLDRQIYRRDALCNLAMALAKEIPPELRGTLEGFDETITEHFSKPLLKQVVAWGLELPGQYEMFLE